MAYGATKRGLPQMTESLVKELEARGALGTSRGGHDGPITGQSWKQSLGDKRPFCEP